MVALVRWYDEVLLMLILAMTFAVLMIICAGVAQDITEYFNLKPPDPQYARPYPGGK